MRLNTLITSVIETVAYIGLSENLKEEKVSEKVKKNILLTVLIWATCEYVNGYLRAKTIFEKGDIK